MSQLNETIPIELIEKINADECVLFIGPNASLAEAGHLGPPGSATLAGEIALRLEYMPTNITLPWVAQIYEDRFGKHALRDFVAERMENSEYCSTPIHQQAANLPCSIMISTAYDRLFDQLLLAQNRAVKYVLKDDDLPPPNTSQLIKLYGTAAQPPSLRLTEEDLERLFVKLPGVANLLRLLSMTQTLLFIGYHLGDAMFRRLFSELRWQLSDRAPAAYLVQAAPEAAEIALWRRRGLITLQADPYQFLNTLRMQLASQKGAIPAELPYLSLPPKLDAESSRMHGEIVVRILTQIGIGGAAEGGLQLTATMHNLNFAAQLMAEHPRIGDSESDVLSNDQAAKSNEVKMLLQYGNTEWAQHNHFQAKRHFEKALKLTPDYVEPYLSLHYLLTEMGELEAALNIYRQCLAAFPHCALLPSKYEIRAVLGMNTLGTVYQVWDAQEAMPLLVTILRSVSDWNLELIENFQKAVSQIRHPRFPRLADTGIHRGRCFIAYEYAEGKVLTDLLQGHPLPFAQVLSILEQIAEALEYAHVNTMPHLGLKPSAIFLTEKHGVQILYLGEAKLTAELNGQSKVFQRSDDYLAPEQRTGAVGDQRSDIYTFGTIAYEMLSGHLPGIGALEQVSSINPETDEAVDLLIGHARSLDPAQRFPNVNYIRQELRQVASTHHPGNITQIARWGLVKISSGLEWLTVFPIWLMLILILAGLWMIAWKSPWLEHGTYIRTTVLTIIFLIINSYPASLLSLWRVRETARKTGFGSIIHSGRGMGAVFGSLAVLFQLRHTTYVGNPFQLGDLEQWQGCLAFLVQSSIVTLMVTFIIISSISHAGRLTQKIFKRYLIGFYGMFLFWCLIILVLKLPVGYMNIPRKY